MAKSRTQRIQSQRAGKAGQSQRVQQTTQTAANASARQTQRIKTVRKVQHIQSLLLPGMVALGCWGLAFSFTFLTNDQNHVLFGALAALMALMWSLNLGLRVRKVLQQK
jgi:Na+-transporting NADH:ubiquinone oxidoreductase subunit NqrC